MSFMLQPFFSESGLFPQLHVPFRGNNDLNIYEHKDNIIVEAATPGVDPKDVHVSYEKGILTVRAEKKEEKSDKEKRYFHKSSSSFMYHLHVPGNINEKIEPKAEVSGGVVKVIFAKQKTQEGPKKIGVKKTGGGITHKAVTKHQPKKK